MLVKFVREETVYFVDPYVCRSLGARFLKWILFIQSSGELVIS